MCLAGDDHWVDHHPVVVDATVALKRHTACFDIDLYLHNMQAVGKGEVLARPEMIGVEGFALLAAGHHEVEKPNGFIGARYHEASVFKSDVSFARFEHLRRQGE